MNDEVLDNMNKSAPGGGSTDKLQNPKIAAKLSKYAAQYAEPNRDESVARMRARNAAIRLTKGVRPRSKDNP